MFIGNISISFLLKIFDQDKRKVVILSTIGLLISDFCFTTFNNLICFITFKLFGSIFMGFYSVLIKNIKIYLLNFSFKKIFRALFPLLIQCQLLFLVVFEVYLNFFAEITRFGDREFY